MQECGWRDGGLPNDDEPLAMYVGHTKQWLITLPTFQSLNICSWFSRMVLVHAHRLPYNPRRTAGSSERGCQARKSCTLAFWSSLLSMLGV